jgi:hypothetical protein
MIKRHVWCPVDLAGSFDRANERWARAEDSWDAIVWTAARDPELGEALTESGRTRTLTLDGAVSIDMPTVTIVYEVDENGITITAAQFEESKYGQSGTA